MCAEISIDASPGEVFARLTAFRDNTLPNSWPRVLERGVSGSILVEFRTAVTGFLGRRKMYRTVERLTIRESEELRFQGVEGPLDLLSDRISLESIEGDTLLRYESTVGLRSSVFGCVLCFLYVRPTLGRFMRQHLVQLKRAVEGNHQPRQTP